MLWGKKNTERLRAREAKELARRQKQLEAGSGRFYAAIFIIWKYVGETRGLDLKKVTGAEWDKEGSKS